MMIIGNHRGRVAAAIVLAFVVGCHRQGKPVDDRTALGEACRLGSGEACERLADLLEDGQGGPRSLAQALDNRNKACALNRAAACEMMGNALSYGAGIEKDRVAAKSAYAKACAAERPFSCARLRELADTEPPSPSPSPRPTPAHARPSFALAIIGPDANPDKEQRCREQILSMGVRIERHASTRATLILAPENRVRVSTPGLGTVVDRVLPRSVVPDLCREVVVQVSRATARQSRAGL